MVKIKKKDSVVFFQLEEIAGVEATEDTVTIKTKHLGSFTVEGELDEVCQKIFNEKPNYIEFIEMPKSRSKIYNN